jgi:hypothetical protein
VSKAAIPAEAREISYESFARPVSPTAASASNRLYGKSGAIRYRVTLGQSGGALTAAVVTAETGDEAAEQALRRNPGWKCINVTPAGDEARVSGGVESLEAA